MPDCKVTPLYIFSDLDGTLGIEGRGIPLKNRKALQQFVKQGGKFGVCTGRSAESAAQFLGDIPVSLPSVVNGGCALHDFNARRTWEEHFLPAHAQAFAEGLLERFPTAALLAVNRQGYFQITPPKSLAKPLRYPYCPSALLTKPWYRLILLDSPERTPAITKQVQKQLPTDLRMERTAPDFVEIMPAGAGKWAALQRLCKHLGIQPSQVVFLGDFYNDLEALRHVGVSACVADAPLEIQQSCHMVLPNCMQGVIQPLLGRLNLLQNGAPDYEYRQAQ